MLFSGFSQWMSFPDLAFFLYFLIEWSMFSPLHKFCISDYPYPSIYIFFYCYLNFLMGSTTIDVFTESLLARIEFFFFLALVIQSEKLYLLFTTFFVLRIYLALLSEKYTLISLLKSKEKSDMLQNRLL